MNFFVWAVEAIPRLVSRAGALFFADLPTLPLKGSLPSLSYLVRLVL